MLLLGVCFCSAAGAIDYKSAASPAVLYDGPSDKSRPMYILARGTPVELVVAVEKWAKVRDQAGEILWIERRLLSDKRTVIVTVPTVQVRAEARESASVVFEAVKDVVLEWQESSPPGWVKVRHADGQGGFVRINQVWGG
jgi:SH3-like domain-containing protein